MNLPQMSAGLVSLQSNAIVLAALVIFSDCEMVWTKLRPFYVIEPLGY